MESEYMSDIEKEKVTTFLNDKILVEAVRKIFLKRIIIDGVLSEGKSINPYENFALNIYKSGYMPGETKEMYTDQELGMLTKLRRFAIELLQEGFKDLEKFRKVEVIKEKSEVNRAR